MSTASSGRPSWVSNSVLIVPSLAWASCTTVRVENGTASSSALRRRRGRSLISPNTSAPCAAHFQIWRAR